jgi:xylulokinase
MWIEALDLVLSRLQKNKVPFSRVRGISGAGQQHGSVFWGHAAEELLENLDPKKGLVDQIGFPKGLSHPWSPNWQDASTQNECDEFDQVLGAEEELARITGSKAHHRFTGPQIQRLHSKHPEVYQATARISLVSSFLASLFLGKVAPIDISDVCGMNLWDVKTGTWSEPLLKLAAGSNGVDDLKLKLGDVRRDGGGSMGSISGYFVDRYGFDKKCPIVPFTRALHVKCKLLPKDLIKSPNIGAWHKFRVICGPCSWTHCISNLTGVEIGGVEVARATPKRGISRRYPMPIQCC